MKINFRLDDGTNCVVYLDNLSIEQIERYMEYLEEENNYYVETKDMFRTDRRIS